MLKNCPGVLEITQGMTYRLSMRARGSLRACEKKTPPTVQDQRRGEKW
jgi:hypothetical protein